MKQLFFPSPPLQDFQLIYLHKLLKNYLFYMFFFSYIKNK
jgi:hypothetical protein